MRQCRQTNRIMFPAKAGLRMSRGNAWLSPLETFFRTPDQLYEARHLGPMSRSAPDATLMGGTPSVALGQVAWES